MKALRLILHEAGHELRAGLQSGIVTLIFFGLPLYLLMSLSNAEYMEKMAATDIPRNAPSLIYLMSTGCMFFLFFAWAWVFAQPLIRDRQACLHEVVLSAPISLPSLLFGRFLGAAVIGMLLGGSVMVGFLCAPLLSWLGLVPTGTIAAPAWQALWFSWLWLVVPLAFGVGALYFMITLRTRSMAGAFGLSAFLMLLWMIAVVVLEGGHIHPFLAAVLDPSLFTFAHAQVESWTPEQKSQALLPISPEFLLNRGLWCALPITGLAWMVTRIRRETLIFERTERPTRQAAKMPEPARQETLPRPAQAFRWWNATATETRWRLRQTLRTRAALIGSVLLVGVGMMASFVHVIWHAEGPFQPHPDRLLPLLMTTIYMVTAFLVAASAGLMSRQDDVEGFKDILDAAPAPAFVRLFALALTMVVITLILALLPGVAGLIVTALVTPESLALGITLIYQTLVMAPALLELAMLALLVHALIRRPGLAYTASMLLTFILVLNTELELVRYPPHKLGIPVQIHFSALTGWEPWRAYLLAIDGYKLGVAALSVAVAGLVLPRGKLGRLREAMMRAPGPIGGLGLIALLGVIATGVLLHQKLVTEGDYRSAEQEQRDQAGWERSTAGTSGDFTAGGGELILDLDTLTREVRGHWRIKNVHAATGVLHAELPPGFSLTSVQVSDLPANATVAHDHLILPLGSCAERGCQVELHWTLSLSGWSTNDHLPVLAGDQVWLRADWVVPRLGIDPDRALRASAERARYDLTSEFIPPPAAAAVPAQGIAPSGQWQWQLNVRRADQTWSDQGETRGAMGFSLFLTDSAYTLERDDLHVTSDPTRAGMAKSVADDVRLMQACVSRRLGTSIEINAVVQWPRGLGGTRLDQDVLQLSEAPDWDVADNGAGRWLRQTHIAEAMARHYLTRTSDLRRGPGSAWLSRGVAGAVGLLCVGDENGITALRTVIERRAEIATQSLANSNIPVSSLKNASTTGWVPQYAPLAALSWTVRQTPSDLNSLLADIRHRQDLAAALTARLGEEPANRLLGPPLSFSSEGERWRWRDGGWQPLSSPADYHRLVRREGRIISVPGGTEKGPGVLLDNWPAYPRFVQHSESQAEPWAGDTNVE